MRKFILIAAAMVLTSAAAQAGDSRSLSAGSTTDTPTYQQPAPSTEPKAPDALRAENDTQTPSTPRQLTVTPREEDQPSETPRYSTRPAPVAAAPDTTTPSTTTPSTTMPSTTTPSTAHHEPADDTTSRPGRTRHAHSQAYAHNDGRHPHYRGIGGTRWTAGRIIAELHRYGIYW